MQRFRVTHYPSRRKSVLHSLYSIFSRYNYLTALTAYELCFRSNVFHSLRLCLWVIKITGKRSQLFSWNFRNISATADRLRLLFWSMLGKCSLPRIPLFLGVEEKHRRNPLIATLKPQSNGPSYSYTVIGTLAVDGWAVDFVQRWGDWEGPQPAQASPRYTKCNSPPLSTASVRTS